MIITIAGPPLTGGSLKTWNSARKLGKPVLHITRSGSEMASYWMVSPVDRIREFIAENRIRVLNVAGSRGTKEPALGDYVQQLLSETFARLLS